MWYEILPSYIIMTAAVTMTGVVGIGSKIWYNGTTHGRFRNSRLLRHYWDRDDRVQGLARKVTAGLEGLPAK